MHDVTFCAICGARASLSFSFCVLDDKEARLFGCELCGFRFVEDPHWLEDSFSSRLHKMDVGSVDRCWLVSQFLLGLLRTSRSRREWRVLDIGGGDGLLVRLLRDAGIHAQFSDPHTVPIYDVGPVVAVNDHFDLGVMSEVALHFTDPLEMFRSVLSKCERALFTAVVPPDPIPKDWWYLSCSSGQHVAFYTLKTIEKIAQELDCHWCSDGKFFHLLSKEPIPPSLRFRLARRELTFLIAWLVQLSSLVARARGGSRSLTVLDQGRVESNLATRIDE